MPRGNFVIAENLKAVFYDGFRGLGAIALVPIGDPHPIA
jgi:hypothetical protein